MANIDTRSLWLFGNKGNILSNKDLLVDTIFKKMMNKTIKMFKWKNLPETIPERELELLLQICRFVIFTKVDGKLFVFYGGLGGMPNEYYQPTQAIVTNPYLKFTSVLNLDDYIKDDGNAVVGWNDSMHMGLFNYNQLYASLIAETKLTLKYQLLNMRFNNVLTADDDTMKTSIEQMFKGVENGTGYGIIVTKQFMEESNVGKIELRSSSQQMQLKDIVETLQYLKGSWLNGVGLNSNFNMKREAINESEADLNEDSLLPDVDDMLEQRKILCKFVNEKFKDLLTKGEIDVEFSSAWAKNRKEIQLREKQQQAQIDEIEQQSDPKPNNVEETPKSEENVSEVEKDEKTKD